MTDLKTRPGDQPLPTTSSKSQNVFDQVHIDLDNRLQLGIKRYGKPLQTFNGRDPLQDAYEEALDLCVYLKQALLERHYTESTCSVCGSHEDTRFGICFDCSSKAEMETEGPTHSLIQLELLEEQSLIQTEQKPISADIAFLMDNDTGDTMG